MSRRVVHVPEAIPDELYDQLHRPSAVIGEMPTHPVAMGLTQGNLGVINAQERALATAVYNGENIERHEARLAGIYRGIVDTLISEKAGVEADADKLAIGFTEQCKRCFREHEPHNPGHYHG
jgi:hypothetical protein